MPQPITYHRRVGFRLYDSVWCSDGLTILSSRFFDLMEEFGATGWTSYPVEIRGKNDVQIEGYRCLVVTGRDPSIEFVRPIPEMSSKWSIKLDYIPFRRLAEDGELDPQPDRPPAFDFFVPETTVSFYVSGRVKRACEAAGLRGLIFKPVGWVHEKRIEGEQAKSSS